MALAWSAGVYNPLAQVDLLAVDARYLEPEEEDWLALARMVGWLTVEDELDAIYFTSPSPTFALEQADWYVRSDLTTELDAIYFTSPPPTFALEQADWYVRSDLTTFLDEPVLLRAAVQQYPILEVSIREAIDQFVLRLGWQPVQLEQFIQDLFEKPKNALEPDDWSLLLFELQLQEG